MSVKYLAFYSSCQSFFIHFSFAGLSDQGHEGRWIWRHSVEDVEFERWASGQPEGIVSKSNKLFIEYFILHDNFHVQYDDCACMDYQNDYMWVAVR